jgi:hypothetical protein
MRFVTLAIILVTTSPLAAEARFGLSVPKNAVRLHIDSDSPDVRVLRYGGTAFGMGYGARGPTSVSLTTLVDECRAPCDEVIQRSDDRFFIGGSGVTMTDAFVLADYQRKGRVDLAIKAGSDGAHTLGLMLAVFGISGVAVGLPLAAMGGRSETLLMTGILTSLAGAALTALGIPVWLGNRTTVTFSDGTVIH